MPVELTVRIVLAVLLVWFLVANGRKIQANLAGRDSSLYWATAKTLINGGNPYSVPQILALEKTTGYASESTQKPKMYRPAPWSMWMILPLGFLSAYSAWVVWMLLSVAALVFGIRICWRIYGDGRPTPSVTFLLSAYLFAPVFACLMLAQMGTVLLLAVVLFFWKCEEHPFASGALLLAMAVKAHFFAAFWPVLLIWIIHRKQWKVLYGAVLAFAAANALAVSFDPAIFRHYGEMLRLDDMAHEFMPNVSGMIRVLFFLHHYWVQFVPAALGATWSLAYYRKHRDHWSWSQHGPWLLVVSALIAPYSWMTDEVALLPAVLQGVAWLSSRTLRLRSQFAVLIFCCFNLLLLLILRAKVDPFTGIYFWSGILWFAWYWYANGFRSIQERERSAAAGTGSNDRDAERLTSSVA